MNKRYFDILKDVMLQQGTTTILSGLDGQVQGWNAICYDGHLIYENRKNSANIEEELQKAPFLCCQETEAAAHADKGTSVFRERNIENKTQRSKSYERYVENKTQRLESCEINVENKEQRPELCGKNGRGKRNSIWNTSSGRIYYETLQQEKKIVICGGGHVSIPLVKMGKMIGFPVTVLEDRPKYADDARRAGADRVICDSFQNGLAQIPGDDNTYFIIVTRGHRYDTICLEMILKKPHAYIGMIGSRVRVAKVKEALLENGADQAVLDRVYTPIGLRIGAETPEEIAVSILAQIIEVKNQKRSGCGYSKALLAAIGQAECSEEDYVLATIVTRRGSAPRQTGTRMLICPDGSCVETIGGGCAEARIREKGLVMIRSGKAVDSQIFALDMTQEDAEEDGMVCGGMVEILLQKIRSF